MSTDATEGADEKPIQVNKWDGSAVKNALDDAVRDVFTNKLKYIEDYKLIDGRLIICSIAVATALFALLWDYLYPFPLSRPYLIYCVIFYFVMMGILTLYVSYIEKGIFIVVIQRDPTGFDPDIIWSVYSNLEKYSDQYQLSLMSKTKQNPREKEASFVKSVSYFFDEDGCLVSENIEKEVLKLHSSLSTSKKNK